MFVYDIYIVFFFMILFSNYRHPERVLLICLVSHSRTVIKNAWKEKSTLRANMKNMGLAFDPNEVLKIPKAKVGKIDFLCLSLQLVNISLLNCFIMIVQLGDMILFMCFRNLSKSLWHQIPAQVTRKNCWNQRAQLQKLLKS